MPCWLGGVCSVGAKGIPPRIKLGCLPVPPNGLAVAASVLINSLNFLNLILLYSMLSLFIMFSNDRWKQLDMTISCLKDMKLYDKCQKMLVVDGKPNKVVDGFDAIRVPRLNNQFSWANMWDAGVATAKYPVILYLDSDRLLPAYYLESVLDSVRDDVFVFTSRHFMVLGDISIENCKQFLKSGQQDGVFIDERFVGHLKYEPRFWQPVHGPGKNVMSGNTAFTKKTYLRLGGVDPWYRGHGAYADTDFHLHAAANGCEFVDLEVPELHYHHTKLDDKKLELDEISLYRLGLDNFVYYCHKWGLPMALAESLAFRCRILQPTKYIKDRLKAILEELKQSPRDLLK